MSKSLGPSRAAALIRQGCKLRALETARTWMDKWHRRREALVDERAAAARPNSLPIPVRVH